MHWIVIIATSSSLSCYGADIRVIIFSRGGRLFVVERLPEAHSLSSACVSATECAPYVPSSQITCQQSPFLSVNRFTMKVLSWGNRRMVTRLKKETVQITS